MLLQTLLQKVNSCPARFKLLVLDTGRLEADPLSGMVVNEFPRLLIQSIHDLPASSDLWVLTSNSWLAQPRFAARRRSVFAYYVTEGLRGSADLTEAGGNGNGQVELNELAHYVNDQVSRWVWNATGQTETQTPLLLRAGVGISEGEPFEINKVIGPAPVAAKDAQPSPAAHVMRRNRPLLAWASPLALAASAEPAPQPAKPADAPTDEATKPASEAPTPATVPADKPVDKPATPTATDKKEKPDATAPQDPVKPPAVEVPPTPKPASAPPPSQETRSKRNAIDQLLHDRGDKLDQLCQRDGRNWGAIDTAPQLCRYDQDLLFGCRLLTIAGPTFVANHRKRIEQSLGLLDNDKLDIGHAQEGYDPALVEALQLRNDLLFELSGYSKTASSLVAADELDELKQLTAKLTKFCGDLDRLLEAADSPEHDGWKKSLDQQTTDLKNAQRRWLSYRAAQDQGIAATTGQGGRHHAIVGCAPVSRDRHAPARAVDSIIG